MVRKKLLEEGKKNKGKLKDFNATDSIPLEVWKIGVTVVSTIFFLNEEGQFVENVPVLMNELKVWLYV